VISAKLNVAGSNPVRMVRAVSDYVFSIADQVVFQAIDACLEAECIVHSFLFAIGGHAIAYQLGIPNISVQTFPFFAATGEIPSVAVPGIRSPQGRRVMHWLATQVYWHGSQIGYRRLRRAKPDIPDLPLRYPFRSESARQNTPLVLAISPTVVPRPKDWDVEAIQIPGYFFLQASNEYQPAEALKTFLAQGPPPVCISFGSTIHRNAAQIYRLLLKTIEQERLRAILLSGWNTAHRFEPSKHLFVTDAVPHDWLLPRCQSIIHHGGAGTTAAGLRAGLPTLVIPSASDQPFWGQRVQAIGAGPPAIPANRLTQSKLIEALRTLQSDAIRIKAQSIGEAIRAEKGVEETVRLIESMHGLG
jgi:UDP:flavonoid glycosyltransferase YjiC (YdhE family)